MDTGSDWAIVRGLRTVLARLRAESARVPRETWSRAMRIFGAGYALALAATAAITLTAMHRVAAFQAWDAAWLERIEASTLTFQAAVFWQALGASTFLIPAVVLGAGIALWSGRLLRAAALVVGFVMTKPLALLGWTLWDRARPVSIAEGLAAPPLHSFPSGHAIQVVSIFGLLAYFWIASSRSRVEKALAILAVVALNVLIGLSRIRMGVHWPSDVVAGTVIGAVLLAALVAALRSAERRHDALPQRAP
jgi:undecaprenyl-diphosphatase